MITPPPTPLRLAGLHPYSTLEPRPAPLPPMRVGTLCAPCDHGGGRVGAWTRLYSCPGGCHVVATWTVNELYHPTIHGVIMWDGGSRWCTMPMGVPLDTDGANVTIPFGPIDTDDEPDRD